MFDEDSTLGKDDHEWQGLGSYELPQFQNLDADQFAKDSGDWIIQTTDFTCAIVSQQMILRQFGIEVSEAQLVYEATSGGFLTSEGSSPEDMGRLLEAYGIATHQAFGLENLLNDLAAGHKVIVAVDSGELWGDDWFLEDNRADHALVVNGLDFSNPANPQAILNDPGHPNGAGMRVPLTQFLDAWSDSDQFYIATDETPPSLLGDPVLGIGFDAASGMYMDPGFWDRIAAARGIMLEHLVQNVDQVSDRLMREGDLTDAYAGAVIKSVMVSMCELTDTDRNDLLREI